MPNYQHKFQNTSVFNKVEWLYRNVVTLINKPASGGAGFKVYTAKLTQVGTAAPTAVTLKDEIGLTGIIRFVTGSYQLQFPASSLPFAKTSVNINASSFGGTQHIASARVSGDNIIFFSTDIATNTDADGAIFDTYIEVRVYD